MSSSRKTATQLGSSPTMGIAGFDFGEKFVEDLEQQRLGTVEHAVIVERASAAEVGARDDDLEAGGFEDFDGGSGGCGKEVVIESVGHSRTNRVSAPLERAGRSFDSRPTPATVFGTTV
jgi:hypothetical protein